MRPRGQLMIEHRLIEKVLALVKAEIAHIDERKTVDQFFIQSIIDFIRTYADRTHHGKEEDILFEQLKTKAMNPDDTKMMDDLVEEHITARRVVSELVQAQKSYINGDRAQIDTIKNKLVFLVNFYPVHITKEDKVFFPNTEKYFSSAELAEMMDKFYAFDYSMIHEKYKKLYESLRTL